MTNERKDPFTPPVAASAPPCVHHGATYRAKIQGVEYVYCSRCDGRAESPLGVTAEPVAAKSLDVSVEDAWHELSRIVPGARSNPRTWAALKAQVERAVEERERGACPCDYEVNSFDIGCPYHGAAAVRIKELEAERGAVAALVEAAHAYTPFKAGHDHYCHARWPETHSIAAGPCTCGYDALAAALSGVQGKPGVHQEVADA